MLTLAATQHILIQPLSSLVRSFAAAGLNCSPKRIRPALSASVDVGNVGSRSANC